MPKSVRKSGSVKFGSADSMDGSKASGKRSKKAAESRAPAAKAVARLAILLAFL